MKDFSFEYIYYRITKCYFKWDGREGITAVFGVSMIQFMIVSDVLAIIARIFVKRSGGFNFPNFIPYLASTLAMLLVVLNYFKYRKKYGSLKSKYKDEPKNIERRKSVIIILLLIAPWVIFLGLAAI